MFISFWSPYFFTLICYLLNFFLVFNFTFFPPLIIINDICLLRIKFNFALNVCIKVFSWEEGGGCISGRVRDGTLDPETESQNGTWHAHFCFVILTSQAMRKRLLCTRDNEQKPDCHKLPHLIQLEKKKEKGGCGVWVCVCIWLCSGLVQILHSSVQN